jgi:mono/diheme cytochrome c family protein
MKKPVLILVFFFLCLTYISFTDDQNKPVSIPPNAQRSGDATKGYEYLITGDYLKSGLPYNLFFLGFGKDKINYLKRTGINKDISHEYTAVKALNGELVVAPNCLQCHAQVFNGELYVGMGNSFMDFSDTKAAEKRANSLYNMLSLFEGKKFEASKNFLTATKTLAPDLHTEVRGVNAASRLAALLVAHRDPVTLKWSDKPLMYVPKEVVPTDVPAWWLLKKKNAMFYNGFGRGDFPKFLMASNLLTVSDTTEATEVYSHFTDVLAYINSIEAPKYTREINEQLAAQGQKLFEDNCAKCHGTYGENETYPNLLIPASIIGTDSALYKSNYLYPQFIEWFNKSWFTSGSNPAKLVPYSGYTAPPLDGIWITAPYLHNGSVPTLEGVLNSKSRPKYWSRDFENPVYNYDSLGWKFEKHTDANRKNVYNTTLLGYGNYGHYFGDKLSTLERKSVIEYLKTL